MQWFKSRYVRSLEEDKSRLLQENQALRKHIDRLVARLLLRNGIQPTIELPPEPSKEALDKMLQATDIFEDIENVPVKDDLVDNRKEQYDEFVS